MELKQLYCNTIYEQQLRLNRTFYGIETYFVSSLLVVQKVLIVPFMELKLVKKYIEMRHLLKS